MRVLVILQNAWSPLYAGGTWPRDSWLAALTRSRSGQRLRVLTAAAGREFEFHYDNTTTQVANRPNGVCPIDLDHVRGLLMAQPDIVVTCGLQARAAVAAALSPAVDKVPLFVHVPHPAWKLLTNSLYRRAGAVLAAKYRGVVVLRQMRGFVEETHHPDPPVEGGQPTVTTYPCSP